MSETHFYQGEPETTQHLPLDTHLKIKVPYWRLWFHEEPLRTKSTKRSIVEKDY